MINVLGFTFPTDLLSAFNWGGLTILLGYFARYVFLQRLRRRPIGSKLLDTTTSVSHHWIWILGGYVFLSDIPFAPVWLPYAYRLLGAYLILSVTIALSKGSEILFRKFIQKKYPQIPVGRGPYIALQVTIGAIGGMIVFSYLGLFVLPVLTVLGIAGIASVLAFQDTLRNLSGGFHLFSEEPLHVGDHIRLESGEEGQVTAINWRTTRIHTPFQQVVIVPNQKIAQSTIVHIYPTQQWTAESVREKLSNLLLGRPFVLVSNREPYAHQHGPDGLQWTRPAGGVTAALDPLMQEFGGVWVAWGGGDADRESASPDGKVAVPPDQPSYTLKRIWLSDEDLKHYYAGYSNGVIWPLCHFALDKIDLREVDWEVYREVNRSFAEGVIEELPKGEGLVWVHDYQLALVPQFLRDLKPSLQICHFWHIPWPPFDVFRALPQRRELLEGLLSADLIGFQVESYLENFMQCVEKVLGDEISDRIVIRQRHRTLLKTFPISINFEQFNQWATAPQAAQEMEKLRHLLNLPPEGSIGIGVDRLEYTKALIERFEAIAIFFDRYPQYRGRFTFIQVAPSSRAEMGIYQDYAEKVSRLITNVNQQHATKGWKPIHIINEKLSHDTLAAYYRMADLAIISSTADGMNLVAKEYVASQVDEKGVLLLSEMAGASEQLEGAYLINPYDTAGLCEAIRTALGTPPAIKRLLMQRMREQVRSNTLHRWVGEIFTALETHQSEIRR